MHAQYTVIPANVHVARPDCPVRARLIDIVKREGLDVIAGCNVCGKIHAVSPNHVHRTRKCPMWP